LEPGAVAAGHGHSRRPVERAGVPGSASFSPPRRCSAAGSGSGARSAALACAGSAR
jgi:hypothetical protein